MLPKRPRQPKFQKSPIRLNLTHPISPSLSHTSINIMIELRRTSPYPVASFYVRKKNVGICVWEGEGKPLQCSIIHSYVEKTKKVISKVMEEKHVKMVLLNKSSHTLIVEEVLDEGLEVMEIQEKGLLDDVIENNLAKLNVNPLHLKLEARQAYIDRMKWEA